MRDQEQRLVWPCLGRETCTPKPHTDRSKNSLHAFKRARVRTSAIIPEGRKENLRRNDDFSTGDGEPTSVDGVRHAT